jgi:hypothetical protein
MLTNESVPFVTGVVDKYPGVIFVSVYDQHTNEYVLCFGIRTEDTEKVREAVKEMLEEPGVKTIMKRRKDNATTKL